MKRLFAVLAALSFLFFCGTPAFAGPEDAVRLSRALNEGLAAWQNVHDYEAHFTKQETSGGKTGPEEKIFLKFEKPFKIFLGWLNTHKQGLQVFYERGKHGGKLAIHQPGLALGLVPVVFLEQSSPWVREGSATFDIEDAGIGTFLEDLAKDVLEAERQNRLNARIVKDDAAGLSADIEFMNSKKEESFMARRVEVFFDAASRLPTRMALYDEAGVLIGRYTYENLALNAGPAGAALKKNAHRKIFRLYTGDRG